MKNWLWRLLTASLIILLFFIGASTFAAASKPAPKEATGSSGIKKKSKLEQAQDRAEQAEKRAQEAEASAAQAARDAKAAQEQAAEALEAARRANEALGRIQETLARLEHSNGQTSVEVDGLRKNGEQLSADVKSLQSGTETVQNKVDGMDQRTEGAVTSMSKFPVKLYGNILVNSTFADRGSNAIDIPVFAQKAGTTADENHQSFAMTGRQSRFGLRYEGTIFDDAKLTGVFEFDMYGGKPAVSNGINADLFRLRLAYGRIDWKNDSVELGQDWSVFSPLNPTTLATYSVSGFSNSGNLWGRFPQVRYEHREDVGERSKLVFTAALLDPNGADNLGNIVSRPLGIGERGALPALESRLGYLTSAHGKETWFGVSGHYSRWLGEPGDPAGTLVRSPIDSYGVSGDANVWLSSGVRISGEAFQGRALGIFAGDIAQGAVVIDGRARGIKSKGGWFEVHVEAPQGYEGRFKRVSANAGYGIENNRDQDLVAGMRKRNQTYMFNTQYKFSPNFTFAIEYRQVQTDWYQQILANQKLNWGNVAFFYSF
jgi:hypothetical protein